MTRSPGAGAVQHITAADTVGQPVPTFYVPFAEPYASVLTQMGPTSWMLNLGTLHQGALPPAQYIGINDGPTDIFNDHAPYQTMDTYGHAGDFQTVLHNTATEFGDAPVNLWVSVAPNTSVMGAHVELAVLHSETLVGGSLVENHAVNLFVFDNIVR